MTEAIPFSLVKPTMQTPFHIDFEWWKNNDRDWRVHLRSSLCEDHQKTFSDIAVGEEADWIDPQTAEVQRVDGLQHILISHCAKSSDFISDHTSLVDSIFRVFLSNENIPLNPLELSERLKRPSNIILRTLSGRRVYKGMRPCQDC